MSNPKNTNNASESQEPIFTKAALHYKSLGYSVFPLEHRGKRPLGPWSLFQTRHPSEAEIHGWGQEHPNANVAIVTGEVSGIFALDADGSEGDEQIKSRGGVPVTPVNRTAHGRHYIFRHPGFRVPNAVRLAKGLDIRGDGGYIVAPRSIHPSGHQYYWEISPDDTTPAPAPKWLLDMLTQHSLTQPSTIEKTPDWVTEVLRGVSEGERDDACYRLACHYLGKGIRPEEVCFLLLGWNERNRPPMGQLKGDLAAEEFIRQKVKSAKNFLKETPRSREIKESLKTIALIELASERELKLKQLSAEMGVPITALRKDLISIGKTVKDTKSQELTESFTPEELEAGRELLIEPELLNRLVSVVDSAGHVGEVLNKKTLILAGVSSRLDSHTINLYIKSASGAGKSFLVRNVLAIMPPSWVYLLGRITTNALFYLRGKDLSHKILFVDEAAGVSDSDYGLRIGISEGELSVLVTTKSQRTGQLEAEEIRVPAKGMVFISTTTKLSLHPEMETRVLNVFIDESEDQTARILKVQASNIDNIKASSHQRVAQAALLQLELLEVMIPFAPVLAERFPISKLRARRDFPKLLSLIRSSALLHQLQREQKDSKLLASVNDYEIAKEIAVELLAQTLKGISPQEEIVLDAIKNVFDDKALAVRKLYEHLPKISYQRLKNIVGQLRDKGILSWNGEQGWNSKYQFVEDPRDKLELPTAEELEAMFGTASQYHVTELVPQAEPDTGKVGTRKVLPKVTESVTIRNTLIDPSFSGRDPDTKKLLDTRELTAGRDPMECICYRVGVLRCGVPCAWAWATDAKLGDLADWNSFRGEVRQEEADNS